MKGDAMKTGRDRWDQLLLNCRIANPLEDGSGYALVDDAAIGIAGHRIVYAGARADLPVPESAAAEVRSDLGGALATPGLIDCHTHLVFAGNRAAEFELRLQGASYQEIAQAGGGINATVRATRAATAEALLATSLPRAKALLRDGVTTIEIKSGYALTLEGERRMLQTARRLGDELGITVSTTFLGLHALPPEFQERRGDYVAEVVDHWLPALHHEGLVDATDAFCEGIAFTPQETRRLFDKARALGLPVKLHADQLSDLGGAALCAEYSGWSADHVEYSSEAAIVTMAARGTVAVLLPGAFYSLRETRLPPIAAMRAHGVRVAIATDLNPGTSPLCSIRLAMNQACTLFRLTPAQAFAGVTVHAASALGMAHRKGRLQAGLDADIAVWPYTSPAELSYWMGGAGPLGVIAMGRSVGLND
jgi:imidazolonepropionase